MKIRNIGLLLCLLMLGSGVVFGQEGGTIKAKERSAEIYLEAGAIEKAREAITEGVIGRNRKSVAALDLGEDGQLMELAPWQQARINYNLGTIALEGGDWSNARKLLKSLPDFPQGAPILSQSVKRNLAILNYRQAKSLIERLKVTKDHEENWLETYAKAYRLLREALDNALVCYTDADVLILTIKQELAFVLHEMERLNRTPLEQAKLQKLLTEPEKEDSKDKEDQEDKEDNKDRKDQEDSKDKEDRKDQEDSKDKEDRKDQEEKKEIKESTTSSATSSTTSSATSSASSSASAVLRVLLEMDREDRALKEPSKDSQQKGQLEKEGKREKRW